MSWTIRLSAAAQNDFAGIIDWTIEQFGKRQATTYARALTAAIQELDAGPSQAGVKQRPEIGDGMFTFHVARRSRKGRHFILFRVPDPQARTLEIVRLLHDSMDLPRHVAPETDE